MSDQPGRPAPALGQRHEQNPVHWGRRFKAHNAYSLAYVSALMLLMVRSRPSRPRDRAPPDHLAARSRACSRRGIGRGLPRPLGVRAGRRRDQEPPTPASRAAALEEAGGRRTGDLRASGSPLRGPERHGGGGPNGGSRAEPDELHHRAARRTGDYPGDPTHRPDRSPAFIPTAVGRRNPNALASEGEPK